MSPRKCLLTLSMILPCCGVESVRASQAEGGGQDSGPALELFEKKIRPVLIEKCMACHGEKQAMAGLRLDSRGGWEEGGFSGAAIIPGDPDQSPLIRAIRHDGPRTPMPLGGAPLDSGTIDAFEQWVRMGALDPRDAPAAAPKAEKSWAETYQERSRWWSLQPVKRPPVPKVDFEGWSEQPVDRFVLAKLEAKGLEPASPADRPMLLRRLSYTLTGLPPAPDETADFVNDKDPGAYSRVVDRLLDSPHFGERWARHWMDVVRYTDTYGYEWDIPAKGSWRYRDYLIRALNKDVPFDQLVREQIAGDLLSRPRIDPSEQINESLIGPMFYQMGEKRHGDSLKFNGIHQEALDNKIDAFSKAFQAMTVACARCHDHKLDAISQRDYYGLAGVFMSSRWVANTLDTKERNRKTLEELPRLKAKLRQALPGWWLEEAEEIPRYLLAAQARIDEDPSAAGLTRGLEPERLGAWEKAVRFESEEEPTTEETPADVVEAAEAEEGPNLADVLYPWMRIHQSIKEGTSLGTSWMKLAEEYDRTQRERSESNARDFSVVADFRKGPPEGWSLDGVGLRHGWVSNGDLAVALEGSSAVEMLLPAGLFTHSLSPRLNGALRTPLLNFSGHSYISMEVSGGDYSSHRLVVDNAFLTERQVYLKNRQPEWVRLSTTADHKKNRAQTTREKETLRVYVELATKTSNPNFPSRVGLGCTKEQVKVDGCGSEDPRSWFGITRAILHEKDESPADELTRFRSLFGGEPPADPAGLASRYGGWLRASLEAWADDHADEDDVRLINWMLEKKLLPNSIDNRESIRELVAAYRSAEAQLAEPQSVNGMADLDSGRDYRVNLRGVYEDLGDPAPRGHVEVLSAQTNGSGPKGSGRLELAELVASPKNPLTARVFVNRVWHWVFGTGIVTTPNDFGHLGDPPSHPQLLEFLADEFVQKGWSVKQLVRRLVMTQTFRQSGQVSPQALEVDPSNRLLHHYPLRRLDAESIRDSLLAVSGRLDRPLYGPPINPYRSSEDATKRLFSGPLDGDGRRSIYLKITIMKPPKFLATFNQPKPKIPIGRRDVTNVPAQALALLNDPFVAGQAEFWAKRLTAISHHSPGERLSLMFQQAFSRRPGTEDLVRWTHAVNDLAQLHASDPGLRPDSSGIMKSVAVWKDTAHAMFNAKEFIYVR